MDHFVSWKFSLWLNEKERNELVPNLMSQEFVEWNLFEIFLDLAAQPSSSSWTLCNTKAEEFCKAKSRANNKFKNFFNIPRIPIYFRKGDSSVCNFQSLGFLKEARILLKVSLIHINRHIYKIVNLIQFLFKIKCTNFFLMF